MKADRLYWFLAKELNAWVWGGEFMNWHELPEEYPVVFISNHAQALGPIAVMCSLPMRVHPWVINDMMEWDKAAEYLRKDFIEPHLHFPLSISTMASKLLSQVSVRLLRAIDCILVWQGHSLLDTYCLSVEHLVQGRSLLIFPEDPTQPMNDLYKINPFYKGFTRLGELYCEESEKILHFYPLAVHPIARKMKIGRPILYNPYNDPAKERIRIKRVLESTIHNLYLDIISEYSTGILLPY